MNRENESESNSIKILKLLFPAKLLRLFFSNGEINVAVCYSSRMLIWIVETSFKLKNFQWKANI